PCGAKAVAKWPLIHWALAVDRSGSVAPTGSGVLTNPQLIQTALNGFVAKPATSVFVNGRDVVGMVSYGANYNLDFAPQTNFQTAAPNIGTAINNIAFGNNSTN